jgi:exosortase/archaeosortase family protein
MRTFVGVLLPVLVLLLMASSASAQDMPDLVLIDIDLQWTVPGLPTPVRLTGSELWRNGVGYVANKSTMDRWHVTGTDCTDCSWANFAQTLVPPGTFVLELEQADFAGFRRITVPFDGHSAVQELIPGEYGITGARFDNDLKPGFSVPGLYFADGGHQTVVAVPELAVLRTLTKHIGGRRLNAAVNPTLQRVTAWGATAILQALWIPAVQRGVYVDLSSVSLEVQEWCSGLYLVKWLLLLALFLAVVGRQTVPWKVALIVVAPLIALEANVLRVAGVGVSYEILGYAPEHWMGWGPKHWLGWGALALGVVQVVGLGWLINRQRPRTA